MKARKQFRFYCARALCTLAVTGLGTVVWPLVLRAQEESPCTNENPPVRELEIGVEGFGSHGGPATISNGTVRLGINTRGHLNVGGTSPSSGCSATTNVGLRYVPTNGEATAPGCLCEGWGVADAGSGIEGHASVDTGGIVNVSLISFTHTPTTAKSVVQVGTKFLVTHDYVPSPATAFLYECTVTIENISGTPASDLRYTRGMDWDIPPNTFSEFVTIAGTAAASNVLLANDNGFNSVNPLAFHGAILASGDFVDSGPTDHGAHFDFGFGALAAGASKTFKIFYGAAGDESAALGALGAVSAEVYSFGQANWNGIGNPLTCGVGTGTFGRTTGQPATFIFAFSGVGGVAVFEPPVANCQDVVAPADLTCTASVSAVEVNDGSSDSDGMIVSFSLAPPGPYPAGSTPVILTVTDDDGLSDSCTATITVTSDPNVFCPADADIACGGSSDPAATGAATASAPCAAFQPHPRFVYVNNDHPIANSVTGYSIGAGGSLSMLPGSPFATGGVGANGGFIAGVRTTVCSCAMGKFLFAVNSNTHDISVFAINTSTGALTLVPGSPFATGGFIGASGASVATTPDGKFLAVTNNDANGFGGTVTVFSIAANGALTPVAGSPFAVSSTPLPGGIIPDGAKFSPTGQFLAMAMPNFDAVAMLSIDSAGALTPVVGSPFSLTPSDPGAKASVDFSCDGNLLFAGNATAGSVSNASVFAVSPTGSLAHLSSFVGTAKNSNVAILSPLEDFLFVSNQGSNADPGTTITVLSVGVGGALTQIAGSPFAAGGLRPSGLATTQSGQFLYSALRNSSAVGGYAVGSSGALTPVPGSPFTTGQGTNVIGITVFPPRRCGDPFATELPVSYSDGSVAGCGATETITRTWTTVDGSGNSASCLQTITEDDDGPPTIACPPDAALECPGDTSVAANGSATGSDTCGDVSMSSSDSATAGCGATQSITRSWTATDDCGNPTSCDQTIAIVDTTPPSITGVLGYLEIECPLIPVFLFSEPIALDECDSTPSLTFLDATTPGTCAQEYCTTRTWTATDDCENSSTASQTICVNDTASPEITCPSNVAIANCDHCEDDAGSASATDDCDGAPAITHSDDVVGTCPRVTTRTWTATDGCGNESECTQTITCVPPSLMTNTERCTFDCKDCDGDHCDTSVRLLFTRDPQAPMCVALGVPNYKLAASNPGQFYYNVFDVDGGSSYSITLPYPWVTQGAQPIHVYDGFTLVGSSGPDGATCPTTGSCLTPGNVMCQSSQPVTLASYMDTNGNGSVGHGDTITVTVQCGLTPSSGVSFLAIHLDYGLKGAGNFVKGAVTAEGCSADANSCANPSVNVIPAHATYTFSVAGDQTGSAEVCTYSQFKNNPGVAGKNANQNATPLPGYQASLFNSTGGLVKQGMTDEDGFYTLDYKHTGKSMIFTVKLTSPTGVNQVKKVTMKANAFVWLEFVTITTE